ncbi:MAG TPA: hypothetical protein PK325_03815 [Cyclobacteriaceae bacterium]|nr:hypothetical protein [Cyclobacteriaceae bacterium]HMV07940.1 hypothetical protein [Cyclobacteriaceae bacterium]HMV88208.1 hypothetical protein [Cyclobacteriaceae bacterium]HMW99074.1 hypothetical protein [Cyclobacteriaceae bacterium]HMX48293.1 hypothetical protein [Cyclobacteriaceae bacterium]
MAELSRGSRNLVILATSIFIVLSLLTFKRDDGIAIGYPWTFYSYSHTPDQSSASWSIQPVFLIIDWLLIAGILVALREGWNKIRG